MARRSRSPLLDTGWFMIPVILVKIITKKDRDHRKRYVRIRAVNGLLTSRWTTLTTTTPK